MDETADLVGNGDFRCTHCYKEVNTVADHLAKLATMRSGAMLYSMLDLLTSGIKGFYLLDKMQVPRIRIRYLDMWKYKAVSCLIMLLFCEDCFTIADVYLGLR